MRCRSHLTRSQTRCLGLGYITDVRFLHHCRLTSSSNQSYLSTCSFVTCMFLQSRLSRICSFLLQIPLTSITKMVLHLFGNYVLTFFDKSFSYTGFEVGKIIFFCIQNTKIITILFIQKLSNHDNQINKTKI